MSRVLIVLCFGLSVVCAEQSNGDTYLQALSQTHGREDGGFGGGFPSGGGYPSGGGGGGGYDYNQVKPIYGPPIYGPPTYGPPGPAYGQPSGYGSSGGGGYGTPYFAPQNHWLLDKFKLKLDLFTVGKILLKLLIFKKIVKFLALICLLLFLPKLKHEEPQSSGEENYRNIQDKDAFIAERVQEVSNFAVAALKSFSRRNVGDDVTCNSSSEIMCRFQRMFDTVDKKYPYDRIVKLYSPDYDTGVETLPEITKKSTKRRRAKQLKNSMSVVASEKENHAGEDGSIVVNTKTNQEFDIPSTNSGH